MDQKIVPVLMELTFLRSWWVECMGEKSNQGNEQTCTVLQGEKL